MRYLSLFSGIGAGELAIHSVFPDAQCLGFSEIDPNALKVYRRHFPDHPSLGDVCSVDAKVFKGTVDLLIGGSPCQGLSSQGLRKGFHDARSALLNQYIRILEECRPSFFILENVRSMRKTDVKVIDTLLGVESVVLDAACFTAQSRSRRFWCNFPVPVPASEGPVLRDILLQPGEFTKTQARWRRLQEMRPLPAGLVCCFIQKSFRSPLTPRKDEKSNTLTCKRNQKDYVFDGEMIRLFEAMELERLQGFPDGYTDGLGITKRKHLIGNAFCVPVVKHIMSAFMGAYTDVERT
jgi:site-specific DNA-cytosine methylase